MVLNPEKEAEAQAVFDKWDLDFAIVGETIAEDRFLIRLNGELMADLPLKALSGEAPEYDRPWVETPKAPVLVNVPEVNISEALLTIMGSPNYSSRAWVWQQYDHMVGADTVVRPGSDAGVVRVHGTPKALAFTSDVTPRYCKANPFEGGKQAVAEAYRNLCATGATPLATTDNMNFGNPEKPEIMGQFVGCIKGISEAVLALDMPIVSGNVSLYNETDGSGILPTPTIGAVGIMHSLDEMIRIAPKDGDLLFMLGETVGHLGQSALLAEVFDREEGDAPHVDLVAELNAGRTLLRFKNSHTDALTAAHDISDGGLAIAATEMALSGDIGVTVIDGDAGWFFGEDQARYLLGINPSHAQATLSFFQAAQVPIKHVGAFSGNSVILGNDCVSLHKIREVFDTGLIKVAV